MKLKLIKSGVFLCVFIAASMISSMASAAVHVQLEVDGNELSVIDNSKPCESGNSTDPCIKVGRKKAPNIKFTLEDACTSGVNEQYKLNSVRITLIKKVWPTSTNPLNELVASDFDADRNTGVVQIKPANQSNDKLKFRNRNSNAYTVFYEVEAIPCDDDSDFDNIYLDPEIRNRGRN